MFSKWGEIIFAVAFKKTDSERFSYNIQMAPFRTQKVQPMHSKSKLQTAPKI